MVSNRKVKELRDKIGVGNSVATELLILGDEDIDLIVEASVQSDGLDHCKARVIDERLRRIEDDLAELNRTARE